MSLTTVNSQTVADYNLLIVDGAFATDAKTELDAMGHTTNIINASALISGYDYSPYDVIIFMYDSPQPASMPEILTLNSNNQLGIIAFRGENIISSANLGTAISWSSSDFIIQNNTHFITQTFSTGVLDLGFTYKSNLTAMNSGNTILGSVGGNGSLVVNNTYKIVLCPYYGHTAGMPWTNDASVLIDRTIAWAAYSNVLSTNNFTVSENVSVFPNPANEFIQVSGLKNNEKYKVYNILGAKIIRRNRKFSKNKHPGFFKWIVFPKI